MTGMQIIGISNVTIYVFSDYRGYLKTHQVNYTTAHLAMINKELTAFSYFKLEEKKIWKQRWPVFLSSMVKLNFIRENQHNPCYPRSIKKPPYFDGGYLIFFINTYVNEPVAVDRLFYHQVK